MRTDILSWCQLGIPKGQVINQLKWPKIPMSDWPPHAYRWSGHDEQRILLWLSTSFDSSEDMLVWLSVHSKKPIKDKHVNFVKWLFPINVTGKTIEQLVIDANKQNLMMFIYDCLERALLWNNPEPHWAPSLHHAIGYSHEYFHAWQNKYIPQVKDDVVSSFLGGDGWGDMGWLTWCPEEGGFVHVFYDVLKLSGKFTSDFVEKPECERLSLKVIQELQYSLERFLERLWGQIDNFEYERKIKRLISNEVSWYKSNLAG